MPEETIIAPPAETQQTETESQFSHHTNFEEMIAAKGEPAAKATESTEADTKPDKKKDDAGIDRATELMYDQLGFRKPKKKDKDAKDQKPEGQTEEATEETPRKVNVRRREPVRDTEEVVTVAATTAAKTVAQALEHLKPSRETAPDPTAEAEALLSEDEKAEYEVFKYMASTTDVHKNLPAQYLTQIRKIADYQRKWEEGNPGEIFNPDDSEHDAFYAKVTPKYSQKEFDNAKIDLAVERRLAKEQGKSDRKTEKLETEMALKDVEPLIEQSKASAIRDVLTTINPELDKLLQEKGVEAVIEADDVAVGMVRVAVSRVAPFIEAARQIDEPRRRIKIDEKNHAHVDYINYLIEQEESIAKGPASGRLKDGKRFATRREFAALPEGQRAGRWFLTVDDLIARRVAEEAQLAKDAYQKENERIEKLAQKRGYSKTNGPVRDNKQERQNAAPTNKTNGEMRSPESLGSAVSGQSGGNNSEPHSNAVDLMTKALFGR